MDGHPIGPVDGPASQLDRDSKLVGSVKAALWGVVDRQPLDPATDTYLRDTRVQDAADLEGSGFQLNAPVCRALGDMNVWLMPDAVAPQRTKAVREDRLPGVRFEVARLARRRWAVTADGMVASARIGRA